VEFRRFGIIGYGHFGRFFAASLTSQGDVAVFDRDPAQLSAPATGVRVASLAEVASQDVVVVAVPYATLEVVLKEIRDQLAPTTVVMDVVSTKEQATDLLQTILDAHPNVLATHPLFGPPSMHHVEPGQRLVVTYQRGERAAAFRAFLEDEYGLRVIEVSPEAHDRAMAYMQSLPFFIARALVSMDILGLPEADDLSIPSFRKLAEIAAIEQHHTSEMFETSQRSNPYADDARRELLAVLEAIQQELSPPPDA
jgi:prephenate dehydrogenase